jgi:hypothetical protein
MPRVIALAALLAVAGASLVVTTPARADDKDACISAAEKSQVERRAEHLGAARELLVSCSADACPTVIRSDCARWLTEVESATPTIVVRATDASGEEVGAGEVAIDGTPHQAALEGHAIALDPGAHKLRVAARGFRVERDFVVREGERDRVIAVQLGPPIAPVRPQVPRGAFILAGAGALSATAGIALWTIGLDERSRLVKDCGKMHNCSDSQIDLSRAKLVVGDVFFGSGVIAIGSALVWGLTTAYGKPKATLSAEPLPGGGALNFRSSF